MLVRVTYVLGGSEDAELFNWDVPEQRDRFLTRCQETIRRGGRIALDASPRHRAMLLATPCIRCRTAFIANKCPVCGWVVGSRQEPDDDNPWAEPNDETPIEKGKGRFR